MMLFLSSIGALSINDTGFMEDSILVGGREVEMIVIYSEDDMSSFGLAQYLMVEWSEDKFSTA